MDIFDMIYIMNTVEEIKTKILPILKEAGVIRSSLFGSFARGENTQKSDVDILVEIKKNISLLDFVDLKLKLEDILGKKVDLVEYGAIKPFLRDVILSEQIKIL